jgi:hypothetical protein
MQYREGLDFLAEGNVEAGCLRRSSVSTLKTLFILTISLAVTCGGAFAWTPLAVKDDPLVRMPGTQPGQATLESPNRCLNCHAGYNSAVEPGFNWQGSMMAHAARDFIFYSCMTVAAQDSIWAVGTPNAVDICERCHFPKGWLEGRSDPTNASLMAGADFDGVQCDFCHRQFDPFFETTYKGTREGKDWLSYWDETNISGTPSQPAADATYDEDSTVAQSITLFSGGSFFADNLPLDDAYTENASGQFFVSPSADKRASFADAGAKHRMLYSRYHKSKYFCSTCHDVSNPVLANLGADPTQPLPTESNSAHSYFHVERTFSEFMLSAYGQQGGAPTNPELQLQGAPDITLAAKCQDCHMRDVEGKAANKNGIPLRPIQSVEHPESGQPLHDLTGGNAWVSAVLASAVPGSPSYDATNDALLNQGPAALTLDLTQGQGIDPVALLAGADRAKQQLLLAATIKNVSYNASTGKLSFRVQNNTGHKLISGFPEGRRMFLNIKAFSGGNLIYEVNPYDYDAGTLKGLGYPYMGQGLPDPQPLGANSESHVDELVYEMHPESDLTGEPETFHFALATGRYKDNRIPPKGFRIAEAADRLSVPVWEGVENADYYTAEEYAGGYDDVSLTIPAGAEFVEVNLYYQTTSREYIEFLRDEINGSGNTTLTGAGAGGDLAYIAQTDPFFSQLKAWGNTIWDLWVHNLSAQGAKPFLMATATATGSPTPACDASVPELFSATPASGEVSVEWTEAANAVGYRLYYDQAGKAQLLVDVGSAMTYTDSGLTNGNTYCYKVTAYAQNECESAYSETLCAEPAPPGQAVVPYVVGETQIVAEQDILSANLTVGIVTEQFSQTVAVGVVIAQDPAGGTLWPQDTVVNLVVSKGPEQPVVVCSNIGDKKSCDAEPNCEWQGNPKKGNCVDL